MCCAKLNAGVKILSHPCVESADWRLEIGDWRLEPVSPRPQGGELWGLETGYKDAFAKSVPQVAKRTRGAMFDVSLLHGAP